MTTQRTTTADNIAPACTASSPFFFLMIRRPPRGGTGLGIWIDTPQWHSPATLKARNVDGVIRYLCMPFNTGPGTALPNKRLERAELDQKIGAGIDVAVN